MRGMVFITSVYPKRTRAQKMIRLCGGTVVVALILYLFSLVPYDILREERHRMYGEVRTTGIVTEVRTDGDPADGSRFVMGYKYIDEDGFARQADALLPRDVWEKMQPGSLVHVFFVRARPHLARIEGEIEPGFQVWLRGMLR